MRLQLSACESQRWSLITEDRRSRPKKTPLADVLAASVEPFGDPRAIRLCSSLPSRIQSNLPSAVSCPAHGRTPRPRAALGPPLSSVETPRIRYTSPNPGASSPITPFPNSLFPPPCDPPPNPKSNPQILPLESIHSRPSPSHRRFIPPPRLASTPTTHHPRRRRSSASAFLLVEPSPLRSTRWRPDLHQMGRGSRPLSATSLPSRANPTSTPPGDLPRTHPPPPAQQALRLSTRPPSSRGLHHRKPYSFHPPSSSAPIASPPIRSPTPTKPMTSHSSGERRFPPRSP